MLRRLSLTLKEQKDVKREVRGAAVPYHEPTSTDDDDDVDDDDTTSIAASTSSRNDVRSWPSTPSTPASPATSTVGGGVLSLAPLELSARALLWSGSLSSPFGSPPPSPVVYLPHSRRLSLQLYNGERRSVRALAENGDVDGLKAAFKDDVSLVNDTDEYGNTALHKAARHGQTRVVRCLLMHGANIDTINERGHSALHVALESGHVQVVAMLLDFMCSLDNKRRESFVLVRAHVAASLVTTNGEEFIVDRWSTCADVGSLSQRRVDYVDVLVSYAQKCDQLTTFLCSYLDVPICHTFIVCGAAGQLSLRNLGRVDGRQCLLQSLTVLQTRARSLPDVGAFPQLRSLTLVDCAFTRLPTLDGLDWLETLDVRRNRLRFVPVSVGQCRRLRTLRLSNNVVRHLPSEIGQLESLTTLDVAFNRLKRLNGHIVRCTQLRSLQCNNNSLVELPVDVGLLTSLEDLRLHNNKLSQLPVSVSALSRLRRISFASNPLINIPSDFPERAADVRQYLSSLQEDPVLNSTVKLVVVGQEGVGKTSLLKAIKRSHWIIPHSSSTSSTDGVDVRDIELDGVTLRCFDCGGDVDVMQTHDLFISRGALYLACFDLSEYCLATVERHSFLFGRLQLWLQYIFCKVPDAQVIIVGTHVDHPALSRTTLEQIWYQLRQLLSDALGHHQRQFSHAERLSGCLLCQTDPRCRPRGTGLSSKVPTDHGHSADRGDGGDLDHHDGSSFINHAFDAGDATCTAASDAGTLHYSDDDDNDDDSVTTTTDRVRCDADFENL